ncbi:MAG: signal peptidase II, partial [Dehalococcoidia bacterium]
HPSNLLRLSLSLQLGGAFGNLVDRLRLGWVTDFIDIGPWPVFNIADASIVTGLVLLGWILTRPAKPAPQPATGGAIPQNSASALDWCPVCDGEVTPIPGGWHCTTCGVKERIDGRYARLEIIRPPPPDPTPEEASLAPPSGTVEEAVSPATPTAEPKATGYPLTSMPPSQETAEMSTLHEEEDPPRSPQV